MRPLKVRTLLEGVMRRFDWSIMLALSILFASAASLYAQEPRQDNKTPRQEEPRQAEPKQGEPRQPEPKQAKPKQEEPRQAEPRPEPRRETNSPRAEDRQEQKGQQDRSRDQMRPAQQDRAQGHARPAGRSAHIPDDRFRAQFGRGHTFAVRRATVAGDQPGFVYGGYTFVMLDPWPSDWAYTDGCYVDYVDGDYYLYDMMHPGMRIALFIVE